MGNAVGPSDPRGNFLKRKEPEDAEETPGPSSPGIDNGAEGESANTAAAGGSDSD